MTKTLYLNLEDDIAKITNKLKREKASEIVLVFPKKSFLFSDSINLRLLKKQVDLLGKKVFIRTRDDMGKAYAKEAGFELKFLPKARPGGRFSDIRRPERPQPPVPKPVAKPQFSLSQRLTQLSKVMEPSPKVASSSATSKPQYAAKPQAPQGRGVKRLVVSFVVLSLIVILLLVLVILPKADIIVYAKAQTVSRDIDVALSTSATDANAASLTMPAKTTDKTVDGKNTFGSSGKKEVGTKAQGRVNIYNLTGKPINLKSTTTILTVGNKNYFLTVDQNQIKPNPNVNDTSTNLADVIAEKGGEDYNLPAGTRVEISNQVFGSQPQKLFAKTVSPIIGGTSRFISVVSSDDIDKAKQSLNNSLVESLRSDLAKDNLVLLDGAFNLQQMDFTTDKPAGTESLNFEVASKVHIQGLTFDKSVLASLIRQRVVLTLSSGKTLQDATKDTLSFVVKNFDFTGGTLALSVHYESQLDSNLQIGDMKAQIVGKSKQQASEILLADPDIDHIDVTLYPTWQTNIPRFGAKINLTVQKQ